MIVVDTDVLAYWFIRSDSRRADLADSVVEIDRKWFVPPVWASEFRNVLATYMRVREMPLEKARRLALSAEVFIGARIVPVPSDDVLRLVKASDCTAYDCEFVAAAQSLRAKLVTGDRKLAAAFPETVVTMEEFVGR